MRDSGQQKLTYSSQNHCTSTLRSGRRKTIVSQTMCAPAERLSQSEIVLPLRKTCYYSPLAEVGVFSTEKDLLLLTTCRSGSLLDWDKIALPHQIHLSLFNNLRFGTPPPDFMLLIVFSSTFISTGFETCAFMPAAKECWISSENAFAVMAIIGIVFASLWELLRIAFAAPVHSSHPWYLPLPQPG